ncbi:SpoIIE family protein phosphatase [Streptomyces formicae]|uniref:SpoIIE family protein phosphatase n=1 Tax=Streptomyces formicae TaxID=1616117 RepID=A0ABY3WH57_9ACTN|nr:SpoIIE family protein phosphatase [Streptomyces formicae]UNM10717.1 SpoIIE family protein phosphatase [Streptomyces formicae]
MCAIREDGAAQPYGSRSPSPAAGSARRAELDRMLELTVRDTGVQAGAVFLQTSDGQALRLEVTAGLPAEYLAPWFGVALSSPGPVADAVRERRLIWLGHPQELARRYPRTAIALPYHYAVAAAPILTGTTAWGALLLFWPGSDTVGPAGPSRERVGAACRRLGRFLRDAADTGHAIGPGPLPRTLPQPPARKREPAEALAAADFAERLPEGSCALDLEGRITYVSATAADLLGGSIPGLIGTRPWQSLPWYTDHTFEDCYRAAVISRKPGYFTAMLPPDRWLAFELYPDGSGVSIRISPTGPVSPAGPGVASQAAPATTGTFQGEPIPVAEVYQVLHLAAALSEAVGVDDVVDLVTDEMLPAFGARTVALLMAEDGRLRVSGYRGYSYQILEHFDGAPLDFPAPPVQVLATGVPIFYATFEELSRAYPPAPRQDGLHAWAFLPLIASGRPVGSCVFAFDRPHPFSDNQRVVFTALAGLIAQALERARLYDTSKELAQTLQAALLPDSLPDLPGLDVAARYLPSVHGMDIGGDFYDLVRVDDTTAAAVIGDVQGHNVTAAALMGRIRPAIRSHAAAGATPSQALTQANRQLVDMDQDRFVSCLYAHLDLARRRAVLATAGHPPPVLRHPDGHAEVLPLPPGLLLGIDPDAEYPSTEIPLTPGTVLTLYTDGLVETPGVDLDDATAGLAAQLAQAGPQPMDRLATCLIDHARQTAPRTDDIALLLIGLATAGQSANAPPGGARTGGAWAGPERA